MVEGHLELEGVAGYHLAPEAGALDAGCGSGKVTAMLADLVPSGRVYAVDVAPSMVEHTQRALGDRVTAFCQDLTELSLPEPSVKKRRGTAKKAAGAPR